MGKISETSKNVAFAAYITPVGWLVGIAARLVCSDRSEFATFHLRQGLGLALVETLTYVLVFRFLNFWLAWQIATIIFFLMMVIGVRSVNKGVMRYQPILGRLFDSWFSFLA